MGSLATNKKKSKAIAGLKLKSIGDFFTTLTGTTQTTKKKSATSDASVPLHKKLKKNESALRQCPMCLRDYHYQLIDTHAATCGSTSVGAVVDEVRTPPAEEEEEEVKKKSAFNALKKAMELSESKKSLTLRFCSRLKRLVVSLENTPKRSNINAFSANTILKEFEDEGKIRCKTTLTVSMNDFIIDEENNNESHNITSTATSNHRLSQSILASALQKNVRRGRIGSAFRVARAMSARPDTFLQCVRRLIVISIEDGALHPDLPFLSWLMIALSKKLLDINTSTAAAATKLGNLKEEVCRIASELAAQKFRDSAAVFDNDESYVDGGKDENLPSISSIQEKFGADTEETHLLVSMIIRAHFGGMDGDVKMLKKFVKLWMHRFSSSTDNNLIWLDRIRSNSEKMDEKAIQEMGSVQFNKFDIPLEAIDFHVSDIVEHCVQDETQRGLLRSAIWHCSSGLNEKKYWPCLGFNDEKEMKRRLELEPVFQTHRVKACEYAMKTITERFD
jgi:hypothetical protein